MNPLYARMRFRLRTLENLAIVSGIFLVFALLFTQFPYSWLCDFTLMGILYFLFTYVLEQRTAPIYCPHCSKHIETNTPWICGVCKADNKNGAHFPFVHKCEHCGAEPKSYKCHHNDCGKLIFLGKDEQTTNYARCVNVSVEETKAETKESDAERWEKEKRTIEHELMMTELFAKLEAAKRKADLEKKRSPRDRLEKSFENHHAEFMGAREIAELKRKEIKEKFKGSPKARKQALESIEDWLRRES